MKHKLIRGSEISDLTRCHQRWDYRWRQLIEPIRRDKKLFFGTAFHKWTEYHYDGIGSEFDNWLNQQDTSDQAEENYDEMLDLLYKVKDHYTDHYKTIDQNYTTIATEIQFSIPITRTYAYTGTIDWIFEDEESQLYFSDHKTVSSIMRYIKQAPMDRQISRYWWALEQLIAGKGYINISGEWVQTKKTDFYKEVKGKTIHRFMYNLILKDVPKEPKELKGGALSKDKSQNTTLEKYQKAMTERNIPLDDPEYAEVLSALEAKSNYFLHRECVFRNPSECEAAMNDFKLQVQDMRNIRIHKTITHECSTMCGYYALCHAEINNENMNMVKTLLYKNVEEAI